MVIINVEDLDRELYDLETINCSCVLILDSHISSLTGETSFVNIRKFKLKGD